jgi:hypothetical protein
MFGKKKEKKFTDSFASTLIVPPPPPHKYKVAKMMLMDCLKYADVSEPEIEKEMLIALCNYITDTMIDND